MSRVVRGVKRGVKKVANTVKKHWRPIVAVGATLMTGGLATIGISGFQAAAAANGFWSTVGSTMWAGATGMAGSLGVGSGASGAAATAAGMVDATLGTGAAAQSLGLARALPGTGASANVGQYTGPFSRAGQAVAGAAGNVGGAGGEAPAGGGGRGLLGNMATAAAPALVQGLGGYFMARSEEEANKPKALWGVDFGSGESLMPEGHAQSAYQQGLLGVEFDEYGNRVLPGHQRYMGGGHA